MPLFPILKEGQLEQSPDGFQVGSESETDWTKASSYSKVLGYVESEVSVEPCTSTSINTSEDALQDEVPKSNRVQEQKPSEHERFVLSDSCGSGDIYDKTKELEKKKKKKKHRHEHRSKKRHGKDSLSPKRSKIRKTEVPSIKPPNKVFIGELKGLDFQDSWRLDTKKDRDNYQFGSLNKAHIARYRSSFNLPIGIPRSQAHVWLSKSHKAVSKRYYDRGKHRMIYVDGERLDQRKDEESSKPNPPFIAVPPLPSLVDGKYNKLGIYDKSTALWNQGKAPENSADLAAGLKAEKDVIDYLNSAVRQKMAALNSKLRTSPSDIDSWLKLISIQDELLNERTGDGKHLYTNAAIHEKKMAILDSALSKNPNNLQLQLARLEMQTSHWDAGRIQDEWKRLLFTHVNHVETWRAYLRSIRNNFAKFSVESLEKAYVKCLKSLRQVVSGTLLTHKPQPGTEESMIEILFELCSILHLANCTEKAIAILQSLIEFNWYPPLDLDIRQDYERSLLLFSDFFDSGVPRFGEPGASGWKNYKTSEITQLRAPLKATTEQESGAEESLLEKCHRLTRPEIWLRLEEHRQSYHWLPWKPAANESADTDCDDPYRLVISDDILPYLFYLPSRALRVRLLFRFLDWFGVKSCRENTSLMESQEWSNRLLFDRFISQCVDQMFTCLTEKQERTDLTIRHLYRKLQPIMQAEDTKEKKSMVKEYKKYIKSILSLEENRNNMELWLTFIKIQQLLGSISDNSSILQKLQLQYTTVDEPRGIRAKLCWSALRNEIMSPKPNMDLIRISICWFVFRESVKSCRAALILRAFNEMESFVADVYSELQNDTSTEPIQTFVGSLSIHCMVTSLTKPLSELQRVVSYWTEVFENTERLKDGLSQLYTQFVEVVEFTQKWIHPGSQALIRTLLQQALLVCPYNGALLQKYIKLEMANHVITRLRQMFTTLRTKYQEETTSALQSDADAMRPFSQQVNGELTAEQSLALLSVKTELDRLDSISDDVKITDTGISHRIRSVCSRDTRQANTSSIQLWTVYLQHEAKHGKRSDAKLIFYAAIQAYPYAKGLYLQAIHLLPELMQEILDICEDKKIRLHTMTDELDILLHEQDVNEQTQQSLLT